MKKMEKKALVLNKETVRRIEGNTLGAVAGGLSTVFSCFQPCGGTTNPQCHQ